MTKFPIIDSWESKKTQETYKERERNNYARSQMTT